MTRRAWLTGALGSALLLSACQVSPLYGTRGAGVPLGSVAIDPTRTRVAQRVRNALIETLGRPTLAAPYRLGLDVDTEIDLFLTDFETDRASVGTARVDVEYTLRTPEGTQIATGRERARVSFDAPLQEFARQRAIRDAENRAAREAAARVRLAISAALAGEGTLGSAPSRPLPPEREPR